MSIGYVVRVCVVPLALVCLAAAPQRPGEEPDVKFPSGKSQREEILKQEHKQSLRDVKEILEVAGQLQADLEKDDYLVLSISSLKKTERIEKLARQIRARIQR
ncbi:MAG: hypothetical protein ABSE56_19425 [Bryobacteraceae bacterium]